jgi:hypothetical protein
VPSRGWFRRYGCCLRSGQRRREDAMVGWVRWVGVIILVAAASLLVTTCAYLGGCWPQRLAVTVEGPAGWRLVRIDDSERDEALPARASKYLGFRPGGEEVAHRFEVSNGPERARCRIRAWNVGGFKTGHRAIPRAVESLDGSLWLIDNWALMAHPAVPGCVWFGAESWAGDELQVDGVLTARKDVHAHSLPSDGAWHEVIGRGWTLSYLADAGTSVHVAEWGSPRETIIRCDEAGFATGTLAIDRASPQPLLLDGSLKVDGLEFELRLNCRDGGKAQVRLKRQGDLRLTLRVSR